MLTMEEVIAELTPGTEARGSLISEAELREVRLSMQDFAFTYARKDGGETICSGCGGRLARGVERRCDRIWCSSCGKDVEVYDAWRGFSTLWRHSMTYIWRRSRRDPETILAKAIYAQKDFGRAYRPEAAELVGNVGALYQFGPDGAKKYAWNAYSGGFSENARSVTPEENRHTSLKAVRHAGLWEALEGTRIGGIAAELDVRENGDMHPVRALTAAARKPYLHHILLQGQTKLARQIAKGHYSVRNRRGKSMPAMLGLTEGQWYEVRRDGVALDAQLLDALHSLQKAGCMTVSIAEAQRAVASRSAYGLTQMAAQAPELLGGVPAKLRRKAVRRAAFSDRLIDWLDYWEQLCELGEDRTDSRILIPRDLHAMHQRMTERINALRTAERLRMDAQMRRAFEERMGGLRRKYSFEACGLILRPFESAEEVIAEGCALHICIGSYARRYLEGGTVLCALRRAEAPEEPWRAVEFSVQSGHLVQDRGAYNDMGEGRGNLDRGVRAWLRRFWEAYDMRNQRRRAA